MDEKTLLSILACPICVGSLQKKKNGYACPKCKKLYPIKDGIIRMMVK